MLPCDLANVPDLQNSRPEHLKAGINDTATHKTCVLPCDLANVSDLQNSRPEHFKAGTNETATHKTCVLPSDLAHEPSSQTGWAPHAQATVRGTPRLGNERYMPNHDSVRGRRGDDKHPQRWQRDCTSAPAPEGTNVHPDRVQTDGVVHSFSRTMKSL